MPEHPLARGEQAHHFIRKESKMQATQFVRNHRLLALPAVWLGLATVCAAEPSRVDGSFSARVEDSRVVAVALAGRTAETHIAVGAVQGGRVGGNFNAVATQVRATSVALAGRTATAQVAIAAVQEANVGGSFSTHVSGVRVTDVDLGFRSASARVSIGAVQGRP